MTGHPDARALALWAGGDLDPAAVPEVGLHLDRCAECLGAVEQIEAAQLLLRQAFAEPSETDLQWVRDGVVRSFRHRRRTIRWYWLLGSAAAALVLLSVILMQPKAPTPAIAGETVCLPPLPVRLNVALEIPEMKRSEGVHHRHAHRDGEAGLRAVNLEPCCHGSTRLRLTTADPKIVILLSPSERSVDQ